MYKRLCTSAGLALSLCLALFSTGCKKQPPITLACNASAPAIYPGDQLTVTATPGSVSTKKHNNLVYSWSGTGVTGNDTSATVATDSLQPGNYTVKGEVKEGKKGKEGAKPGQTATCSADYTVKPFEPPTISCSASPTTIQPGGTSTITAQAVSPQNRPLTYSYSASAGSIEGTGTTAEFNSSGAPTGEVGITCKVSDDKGNTESASSNVTILAPPPPPPPPHTQALCSIGFSTDTRRPMRVDNEAKACLDQVALALKQQPDAKAVIVGDSDAKEKTIEAREQKRAAHNHRVKVQNFAAQRAVNAKNYLVEDQGIDASRVTAMTGSGDDQSAQDYLVPAGANFESDVQGTSPVDESEVKPQERKPLPERHHRK
jgi:outer membrane protein OmpA-like peptidoglycan-associated protein